MMAIAPRATAIPDISKRPAAPVKAGVTPVVELDGRGTIPVGATAGALGAGMRVEGAVFPGQ